tara:strand:+ start:806 stop:1708 length:903 start_codon:yes stop_codon:yes gene_type:complete
MKKGITYTTTGERSRSQMNRYHGKPSVLDHSYGATEIDVKNIKSKVTNVGLRVANYRSNYTIGFEIEKSTFGNGTRKEYALIQGYERDGSCGVEAVTNILPLLPPSQWRNKIFDMIYKAKGIMDDELSPSTLNCGGHITIAVNDFTGQELNEKVRLNASVLLALFRKRLKNGYVRYNLRMQPYSNILVDGNPNRLNHYNGWDRKYQLALAKPNTLEFRLPTRITSYKQMFRRYELMYQIVDFSITKPNGRFSTLLNKVKPTILSMYEGDTAKVDMIMLLAKDFYKFIKRGEIHERIARFI